MPFRGLRQEVAQRPVALGGAEPDVLSGFSIRTIRSRLRAESALCPYAWLSPCRMLTLRNRPPLRQVACHITAKTPCHLTMKAASRPDDHAACTGTLDIRDPAQLTKRILLAHQPRHCPHFPSCKPCPLLILLRFCPRLAPLPVASGPAPIHKDQSPSPGRA